MSINSSLHWFLRSDQTQRRAALTNIQARGSSAAVHLCSPGNSPYQHRPSHCLSLSAPGGQALAVPGTTVTPSGAGVCSHPDHSESPNLPGLPSPQKPNLSLSKQQHLQLCMRLLPSPTWVHQPLPELGSAHSGEHWPRHCRMEQESGKAR